MAIDTSALKVYCRGVDLSTALQSTALDQSRDEVDDTVFASTVRSMQATLGKVALAHAGLYTDGANSIGEVFRQAASADAEPFTLAVEGATRGKVAFIVTAHRANISMPDTLAPGTLAKASLSASSQDPVGTGVVEYVGAVSSDSQSLGVQLGALAAGQSMFATIHITGMTTTPAAVFYLESDDNSSFTSATVRATSASQTARGSVLLTAAGAITDDYWRVRWDWTTPGSFDVVICLGIAG